MNELIIHNSDMELLARAKTISSMVLVTEEDFTEAKELVSDIESVEKNFRQRFDEELAKLPAFAKAKESGELIRQTRLKLSKQIETRKKDVKEGVKAEATLKIKEIVKNLDSDRPDVKKLIDSIESEIDNSLKRKSSKDSMLESIEALEGFFALEAVRLSQPEKGDTYVVTGDFILNGCDNVYSSKVEVKVLTEESRDCVINRLESQGFLNVKYIIENQKIEV